MKEGNEKMSFPEINIDTQLLYKRIKSLEIDETVTYEELSGIIGSNVRLPRSYSHLSSARKKAEHNDRIFTIAIWGKAIMRLEGTRINDVVQNKIEGIRRKTKRTARILTNIQSYDQMTQEQKMTHNAQATLLTFLYMTTDKKSIAKIESKVKEVQEKLPLAKTLEVFSNKE